MALEKRVTRQAPEIFFFFFVLVAERSTIKKFVASTPK